MWNYFDEFRLRATELPGQGDLTFNQTLHAVFPRLKIIFIRRRDKVAQAVSLWKAIQSQQWRTESESESEDAEFDEAPEVQYDYRAIEHLRNELHRWDADWEDWFHATGREPIRVFYDEFTVSRAATIGRVLDALGIDPPAPEGKKPMKRQADDLSSDWVARFRAEREQHQRI
jgi:LPS sulfotransferase NodH